MPIYLYKNEKTQKVYEVLQSMSEEHKFFDPETGEECKRVWTVPNASVSSLSNSDPFNIQDHVKKTGNMKGSMGDLYDISKEMSERRADKIGGEDPIKTKLFKDYEKKNKCKHFYDRPSKIETKNATIDFTKSTKEPKLDL